jgi:MraZ protein
MLIGNFSHSLDSKKRLSIPAKWRVFLGEKVILTTGLDKSLFVFSESQWLKIAEDISRNGFLDADARNFSRFILSNAFELSIDSHGRILIPDTLVTFSELKTDVVLAGNFSRAEIWDKTEYEKVMKNIGEDANGTASRMSKITTI